MTDVTPSTLREILVARYDEFRGRLARRLGSLELASDSLQETWLRLTRIGNTGAIRNPEAYLFRIAVNVAADQRAVEQRRLAYSEVELLLRVSDDELDPERIVASRFEQAALIQALDELPPRRRAIFIMARLEKRPHREIAEHFGISVRMVDLEWNKAMKYCREQLEKKL